MRLRFNNYRPDIQYIIPSRVLWPARIPEGRVAERSASPRGTLLRLGELFQDALPARVLQVLADGDELGRALTEHAGIHKISFTGSVPTGKRVMASASGTLKRVTLELGGNDAGIVLDDIDPAAAGADLFWAGFSNSGQVCAELKRLYVPDRADAAMGASGHSRQYY